MVVKPAVAGGSRGAARFIEPAGALAHSALLHRDGHRVLVQPFDPLITAGETALVYLAGERSHAFTKGPMLPQPGESGELDESGLYLVEKLTPALPPESFWALGDAVMKAAAARGRGGAVGSALRTGGSGGHRRGRSQATRVRGDRTVTRLAADRCRRPRSGDGPLRCCHRRCPRRALTPPWVPGLRWVGPELRGAPRRE